MTCQKKGQEEDGLSHLPIVKHITGGIYFFRMRVSAFVKKIEVSIYKSGAKKGVITRIVASINRCDRIKSRMQIRRNPRIKNPKWG